MKITKKSLTNAGYNEFVSKSVNYENGKLLTFEAVPKFIDFYYQTDLNYLRVVTGNTRGRGNAILFSGKVDTIKELKWVIKSVSAYIERPQDCGQTPNAAIV